MKFTNSQITDIINLSENHFQKDIAKLFNTTQPSISRILKNNGISQKRSRISESWLKFDEKYFENINSYDKAYWLGFISADGCLKNNKVRLVSKDLEVIEKFKKSIKSEHKIVKSTTTDKRSGKNYTSYIISITNNKFTKTVEKFIPINKSYEFILPKINKKYMKYFIAGMFDGDGSIGLKNGKLRISLISSKECLNQIQSILYNECNIGKTKIQDHYTTYRMYLYKDSDKFLEFIYDDDFGDIYLSRKYKIWKEYETNLC
jgi:hypothetical protein